MKQEDEIIELNASDLEIIFGGAWIRVNRLENGSWVRDWIYIAD